MPASRLPEIGIGAAAAARSSEGSVGAASSSIETWRTRGPGEAGAAGRFLSRSFGSLRGLRPACTSRPLVSRVLSATFDAARPVAWWLCRLLVESEL